MGIFGLLILIGVIGLIFSGIGRGFYNRRRFGHFRPFGFWGHRPPPREPGWFDRGPGMHGGPGGRHGDFRGGPGGPR